MKSTLMLISLLAAPNAPMDPKLLMYVISYACMIWVVNHILSQITLPRTRAEAKAMFMANKQHITRFLMLPAFLLIAYISQNISLNHVNVKILLGALLIGIFVVRMRSTKRILQ